MTDDEILNRLIPYRMHAVETLNYALRLRSSWVDAPPMTMHVNGEQVMEGNLNAFTNPAIEAGLMHCRALLEFLGLNDWKGKLGKRQGRQPGDVGIERFSNAHGPLSMVDPEQALSKYGGSRDEAETALLAIFHITNKGLAHITTDLRKHPEEGDLIEIASRGVPSLVVSYLYTPLGLPAPNYKINSRSRAA